MKAKNKGPGCRWDAFLVAYSQKYGERDLCRWTGTRHHGGYRIARAFPHAEQQHFSACRILKHVVRARKAFHFIKARPARIWPRRRTLSEKLMQFSNLFPRMVSQIFHEGRFFGNGYHHYVSPPHSAYLLPTSKDVENRKMFHGSQQFLSQIGPLVPSFLRLETLC
jgi:hypothetical protein